MLSKRSIFASVSDETDGRVDARLDLEVDADETLGVNAIGPFGRKFA